MALTLVCLTLTPCIYFCARTRHTLEEDVLSLQLPAHIDQSFFMIQRKLQNQLRQENLVTEGSGVWCVYNTRGRERLVPYCYSVDVRKLVEGEEDKACLALVTLEIFPGQPCALSVQRSLSI